ncbi:hypothetical protein [Rhodoferax sp.]|uniref:hypothetical protein n=1 Tax=Rhodoferax sp. TaxID=50421 RepID=UPI00374CD65C
MIIDKSIATYIDTAESPLSPTKARFFAKFDPAGLAIDDLHSIGEIAQKIIHDDQNSDPAQLKQKLKLMIEAMCKKALDAQMAMDAAAEEMADEVDAAAQAALT